MLKQVKSIFFVFFVLVVSSIFGQDSLKISNSNRLKESELVAGKNYVIDTIINGQALFKETALEPKLNNDPKAIDASLLDQSQEIKPIEEKQPLLDNALALELDKKWLTELYNTSLYDTIYKTVTDLDYKTDVYYPDLPTDTLKARLAEINSRTPFNVEYNPSLERVIKSFLKNRRNSLEKLMGLSHFYFPITFSSHDPSSRS